MVGFEKNKVDPKPEWREGELPEDERDFDPNAFWCAMIIVLALLAILL